MARRPSDMGGGADEDDGRVGVEDPYAERSYTELKVLGDGSFGTVWLCDWHSPVKSDVLLSAMQCGQGARAEWAGKRLVALKRMKRVWEGGWRQARNLGELASLRSIPPHPAVIPLYDAFISPRSRELYFVFECMEGNLYQLTKSRKGRPLAAGLIASCFHQMVSGLQHVHRHGFFHRDMKPENLLVTTTGLCEYLSTKAVEEINARRAAGDPDFQLQIMDEKDPRIQMDVQVIIKLADFGLARAINSKPPYTEYVSTRWYRAPEVLLRATDYGAPVDMWALGTILAEMINLKPLFPGSSEIDQVYRICEVLGDPSPEYGPDANGRINGGGRWNTGIKLAKRVGFSFPKRKPLELRALFPKDTPRSLIDCVANLLRYNPRYRMTSDDCMTHLYFREVLPHLQRVPPLPRIPFAWGQPSPRPTPSAQQPPVTNLNVPSRHPPPSHSHHEPHGAFASGELCTLPPPSTVDTPVGEPLTPNGPVSGTYFTQPYRQDAEQRPYGASALVRQLRELDLPTDDLASYGARRWSEAELVASRQRYANSVHAGSVQSIPDSVSNPSYSNLNSLSAISLDMMQPHQQQHHHQRTPDPHVMAYVRQQAAYQQQMQQPAVSQSTPNLAPTAPAADPNSLRQAQSTMTLPLPSANHMPPPNAHMAPPSQATSKLGPPPPAPIGKKKKWGLSSVFGGAAGKNGTTLPSVDEHAAATTSLKRTQSGQYADDRVTPGEQSPSAMDPKLSKKEAERQSRELLKAKREAAERAQKERARAVLNKRAQLVGGRKVEMEYSNIASDNIGLTKQVSRPVAGYPSGYPSSQTLPSGSITSLASFPGSGQSPYLQVEDGMGRNKARKQYEEDDHSSIGRVSAKSRSLLSVATMDSDPTGSRRSLHNVWPEQVSQSSRRPPSNTYRPSMSHSSASLDNQLSSQLQRTTVQSASESSLSLGRNPMPPNRASMSGPSIQNMNFQPQGAYAYPAGHAMTIGASASRRSSRAQLPSIEDGPSSPTPINPMFKVPPGVSQPHPGDAGANGGLPPFSSLINLTNPNIQNPPQ
ncbi:kinase-like protein [Cutaneotrichosporon oleaginosum]|uniref:Kinase-like protein n=1 Tax=Cutaneotrichosporon oleaginosum TaxID=879819 RepID=A0A0J0XH22_9TREE|nr:kinase-like protein [Cutaneotrichosporon oleaginosum]KLT40322.1 kinase-like protein [Cutaneotrichosporon oleaginosum]TXT07967.1 hypothetical protein COLE_04891 [Cutaneotrichosporon oleaginosum]